MKTYREQYDELRFSPEEKQAMVENLSLIHISSPRD